MPDSTPTRPEATVRFTCAASGCDWERTAGRFDTEAGVQASLDFDTHEATAHPDGGAHLAIETTYA